MSTPQEEDKDSSTTPRNMSRRYFLGVSLTGGATLLLTAAAGSTVAEAATRRDERSMKAGAKAAKGTLVVAVASDPGGFDQDYLAFDLVGLSLMKNFMPFAIDYPVVPHGRFD